MLAFSNAYVIAKQFKSKWIKAGLYTVGMVPGLVRVLDRFHWISDVAFSTALSIFMVESIDRYLGKKYSEKYNANPKGNTVSWNLTFGMKPIGSGCPVLKGKYKHFSVLNDYVPMAIEARCYRW